MLRIFRNKKAQSTAEYAVLIGIVVAAVISMQTWMTRRLQARIFDAADGSAVATQAGLSWPSNIFVTDEYEPNVPGTTFTERKSPIREYIDTITNDFVIAIEGEETINRITDEEYTYDQ